MGSCTRRHFLLSTCFLQMITVIERQVFDFLGYMWAPIFVNFFHIIFVIFGFYGAYHFRVKYIITYLIWTLLWMGWNAFLICFYLDVGDLDKDSDLLNLGTGSVSWFEVNGYGCKPTYPTNITSEDPYRPIRPERVDDCLLNYPIVEVIHSGVQCVLALFGVIGALMIAYLFLDEDDRFDFMNGDAKSPQHTVVHPMYVSYSSIPTSASATILSNKHNNHNHNNIMNNNNNNNNKNSNNNNNNPPLTIIHDSSDFTTTPINDDDIDENSIDDNNKKPTKTKITTTTAIDTNNANAAAASAASAIIINNRYYDDSTATADQLYTNSNRRQMQKLLLLSQNNNHLTQQKNHHHHHHNHPQQQTQSPLSSALQQFTSSSPGTTSSLSYASLHKINDDHNSVHSYQLPYYNNNNDNGSKFMITTNSSTNINNNNSGGRFIKFKQQSIQQQQQLKPSKSSSYSSFINITNNNQSIHRPDIKYTQISTEQPTEQQQQQQNVAISPTSMNYDESFDDVMALQNFTTTNSCTYVQFLNPYPSNLYVGSTSNNNNNNNTTFETNSYSSTSNKNNNINNNNNSNNLMKNDNYKFNCNSNQNQHYHQHRFYPHHHYQHQHQHHASASIVAVRDNLHSPPPPPPPPRHAIPPSSLIFHPRSGHHPCPDLSPEVTEKYSMPYQYVPRSPVINRIIQRRRQQQHQQQQHERSHLANTANFCDQIRDKPPGYKDSRFNVVRAKSHDRLSSSASLSSNKNSSPAIIANGVGCNVNRRSSNENSKKNRKQRPRSYCNSGINVDGGGGDHAMVGKIC